MTAKQGLQSRTSGLFDLIGIDVASASGEWLSSDEWNVELARVGMTTPLELFRGVPASVRALEGLIGISRYGCETMEGLIVRRADGEPRVAKLVRDEFTRFDDANFGHRRNTVVQRTDDIEASWDEALGRSQDFRRRLEQTISEHSGIIERLRQLRPRHWSVAAGDCRGAPPFLTGSVPTTPGPPDGNDGHG